MKIFSKESWMIWAKEIVSFTNNYLPTKRAYFDSANTVDDASSLSRNILQDCFKEVNYSKQEEKTELLHVIDAFDAPKSIYCEATKKLIRYKHSGFFFLCT